MTFLRRNYGILGDGGWLRVECLLYCPRFVVMGSGSESGTTGWSWTTDRYNFNAFPQPSASFHLLPINPPVLRHSCAGRNLFKYERYTRFLPAQE